MGTLRLGNVAIASPSGKQSLDHHDPGWQRSGGGQGQGLAAEGDLVGRPGEQGVSSTGLEGETGGRAWRQAPELQLVFAGVETIQIGRAHV